MDSRFRGNGLRLESDSTIANDASTGHPKHFILTDSNEKMGKNENFGTVFFSLWNQLNSLWKTGGPPKNGQNVCKIYTLSVGGVRIADCRLKIEGKGGDLAP